MQFVIRFLNARGELSQLRLEAGSANDARIQCRIPNRRIVDVREDRWGRLRARLETGVPGMKNQAIFLQNLSSALAAGKPIRQSVMNLIQCSRWIRVKPERLAACEDLADFLRVLNFDQNSVLLAETAQRSGQYSEALRQASRYLIEREQINGDIDKELRVGWVYFICGVLFLVLLPFFMHYGIEEIKTAVGARFEGNSVTTLLMIWHELIRLCWPVAVILIPLIYWFRDMIFLALQRWPFVSTLHYKQILDRAQRFLDAYQLLNEAGIIDSHALLAILESSSGEDRKVFQRIYARLAGDQDLATAFSQEQWPLALSDAMQVLPQVTVEERKRILVAVKEAISIEHRHVARVVAGQVSRMGFTMMLISVIAAAVGFYVPLANMATSFG